MSCVDACADTWLAAFTRMAIVWFHMVLLSGDSRSGARLVPAVCIRTAVGKTPVMICDAVLAVVSRELTAWAVSKFAHGCNTIEAATRPGPDQPKVADRRA